MINNDYQELFHRLKSNLQQQSQPLNENDIDKQIDLLKGLLITNESSPEMRQFFGLSEAFDIDKVNFSQLKKELETYFNVSFEKAAIILGELQKERNNTWWTDGEKNLNELYYWKRYRDYISKDFPLNVVQTINTDTDAIINNLAKPSEVIFERYGMTVGHVQSGKTSNYSAVIAKACDAGYKFIIVIAGGINNLRNQTQVRINEAIVGKQNGELVGVGKLGGVEKSKEPITLTTPERDFNKGDADLSKGGINFDTTSVPVIMVIKKQTNTLTNVIDWLKSHYKGKVEDYAMLMIDDESDYASINTKKEDKPSTINRKLRELLGLFNRSAYLAYTATPYANIFIDHKVDTEDYGKDLFPSDFIIALNAPNNYFGARKIFLNNNEKHIVHIKDNEPNLPLKHKKDDYLLGLPNSLYEAIRVFLINIAIRDLREQNNKHNSMLIHVSRFTAIIQSVSTYVERYLEVLQKDVTAYGLLSNPSELSSIIKTLESTFNHKYDTVEFNWKQVLAQMVYNIKSVVVRDIHQLTKTKLVYTNKQRINVIAVGGTSLSRGYTLEGLHVSYFLRTTAMYDTLMQMGRWFGYRFGYEDLCKIYIKSEMEENFANIIEATEDLFDHFRQMEDENMTPRDFGLSVKQHPDSALQVTARNKRKNTKDYYFEMNLDGSQKETIWLKKDKIVRDKNLIVAESLVEKLVYKRIDSTNSKRSNLWLDVDKKHISNFLEEFSVYEKDPIYNTSKMPIGFIRKYADDINTTWDVLLATGQSEIIEIAGVEFKKEYRVMKYDESDFIKANNRQIAAAKVEKILFEPEIARENSAKKLRGKMKKPLLVIHIIDTDESKYKNLVAFGISFPGGIKSESRVIKHTINSVFVENLINATKEYGDDIE
jgi:hypothetical protein